MTVEQLLTSGGVLTVLGGIVLAFYLGKIQTTASAEKTILLITTMWADRFADKVAESEAWKAQAQSLTPAVESLAAEIEVYNLRDMAGKQG